MGGSGGETGGAQGVRRDECRCTFSSSHQNVCGCGLHHTSALPPFVSPVSKRYRDPEIERLRDTERERPRDRERQRERERQRQRQRDKERERDSETKRERE